MPFSAFILRVILLLPLVTENARGGDGLPPETVTFATTADFRPTQPNWHLASALAGDPRTDLLLTTITGTGLLVCNPAEGACGHLVTAWEHGDIEVELEFLLPPGSNSGVYLQGRYEIQLIDSWGVRTPTARDCGEPSSPHSTAEASPAWSNSMPGLMTFGWIGSMPSQARRLLSSRRKARTYRRIR